MRVVVTGGSGRLGQFVVRELFTHAHQVSVIDAIKPRECLCPTYTVDLSKTEGLQEYFTGAEGVVHLARQGFPYTESGFNASMQRWEFPGVVGDAERFNLNVAITNNVMTAAEATGVKKIVCGSSLAVYGFYYPKAQMHPDYLPIDEHHPLQPQDPYGLTKLVGERLCDALSRRSGVQIASLRFSGIYTEMYRGLLLERKKNPLIRGAGALWSYVDARDAARACRLALESDFTGHEAFNLCAPETIMDEPTLELVGRYLSQVNDLREGLDGRRSGYAVAKARNLLGFEAKMLLKD